MIKKKKNYYFFFFFIINDFLGKVLPSDYFESRPHSEKLDLVEYAGKMKLYISLFV
jgi:hypothetical protein